MNRTHVLAAAVLGLMLVYAACSSEPSPQTLDSVGGAQLPPATASPAPPTADPTARSTPEPAATTVPPTRTPDVRATVVAEMTATAIAQPTESVAPTSTLSPSPAPTATPTPALTATPVPVIPTPLPATPTPAPTASPTPEPTVPDSGQDTDREAPLEAFAQRWGDAMAMREWAFAHGLYPDEFRERCTVTDFAALMTSVWAFYGVPEGATYVVEGVRVDGDHGWVDGHYEKDGVQMDLDTDGDVEPEAVWWDGEWAFYLSPAQLAEGNLCALDEPTPTGTPEPVQTPSPTSTPIPTATPPQTAVSAAMWYGLEIDDEDRCSPYDPDDYPYPQSVEARIVAELGDIIYGPYTGRRFSSTRETDIEHMVARSEAHDSGLCAADSGMRRRFASDLLNLTLASPGVNRHQKSDKDAAEWLPDLNQCWFADRVIRVRQEYDLTIDQIEADALDAVLSGCSSFEMVVVSATEQVSPTLTPTPTAGSASGVDALAMWDDNGNGRISCAEARNHGIAPVRRGHPAYPYMNDRDGDGVVCE